MIVNPAPCNMLKRFFKFYFFNTLKSLKTTRLEFDFQIFSGGVPSYFGGIPYPPPPKPRWEGPLINLDKGLRCSNTVYKCNTAVGITVTTAASSPFIPFTTSFFITRHPIITFNQGLFNEDALKETRLFTQPFTDTTIFVTIHRSYKVDEFLQFINQQ